MAFVNAWVETDPDGSVIPVSQLDNSDRLIKGAIRERLEGDSANPDLTGLIEVGSFTSAPKPRKGTARVYVDTIANIVAFGATKREDGRLAISTDVPTAPRLYHVAGAAVAEIGYMRVDGTSSLLGTLIVNPAASALTGVVQRAEWIQLTGTSSGTNELTGLTVDRATAAAAYVVPITYGVDIKTPVKGAGSTITAAAGLHVSDQGVAGATNAYGLLIEDQTTATNKFAIKTGLGTVQFGDGLIISRTQNGVTLGLLTVANPGGGAGTGASIALSFAASTLAFVNKSTGMFIDISGGGSDLSFLIGGGLTSLKVFANGDVALGLSAPALGATLGFPYIPVFAGVPSGVLTPPAGFVAIAYDGTNNRFRVFNAGAWHFVQFS